MMRWNRALMAASLIALNLLGEGAPPAARATVVDQELYDVLVTLYGRPEPPLIAQKGWRRYVGLAVRGGTFGLLGADVPPRTGQERAAEASGPAVVLGLIVGTAVAVQRGVRMQRRHLSVAAILAGVAFLVFNLPAFLREVLSPRWGGSEPWMAVGAVLLVAGILAYRSAGRTSDAKPGEREVRPGPE